MPVIALVGNKGGAGKTTLAMNLAAMLTRRDSTVVLDADPQHSARQWGAIGEDEGLPRVVDASQNTVEVTSEMARQYRHLVVDCPPSIHAPQTLAALQHSDIALIPVQPSPVDLWATVHIEGAVSTARESNPNLRALLVINQLEVRTTLSRLIRDALAELELPAAATAIRRRAVFRASALEGKSVIHMGRRGEEAAEELDQLINEVLSS